METKFVGYRCKVNIACPCVEDSRYDPYALPGLKGKLYDEYGNEVNEGSLSRRTRAVRMDNIVPWVDPTARKHFEPMGAGDVRRDEADAVRLRKELEAMGFDLPADAELWELSQCYDDNDPRLAAVKEAHGKFVPARKFKKKVIDTKVSEPSEADELRAFLDANGVSYHPSTGMEKLRKKKAEYLEQNGEA